MPTVRNQQVYFKRLILSNVRSFGDEQRLEMVDAKGGPAQWTLIIGDNGVGKTTLLQCLASMCPVPAVPADKMPKGGNLTSARANRGRARAPTARGQRARGARKIRRGDRRPQSRAGRWSVIRRRPWQRR